MRPTVPQITARASLASAPTSRCATRTCGTSGCSIPSVAWCERPPNNASLMSSRSCSAAKAPARSGGTWFVTNRTGFIGSGHPRTSPTVARPHASQLKRSATARARVPSSSADSAIASSDRVDVAGWHEPHSLDLRRARLAAARRSPAARRPSPRCRQRRTPRRPTASRRPSIRVHGAAPRRPAAAR